jgi:hypothetical protein
VSFALWDEPLSAAEREALLDRLSEAVARRGLETPVLMALEVHRPMAFLASQGLIIAGPLLAPLLGLSRIQDLSRLLREPGAVDALIARIEEKSSAPEAAKTSRQRAGDGE